MACERHFLDLKLGGARGISFHAEKAKYAIRFFQLVTHSKGEWAGQPVVLEPWQEFVVGSVFGWRRTDGTRRFRSVYEEIPRKNGKSLLLSGVGLYALVADREEGAEIYAAATKKDQAEIIFGEARRMAMKSPALRKKLGIFKKNISIAQTASKFEPLSSDERTLDGLNPHCVLIDELHKHKSRALLDVLDTALGSRRQPLLWIITTAGDDNPESVYATENAHAISVLERTVEDDWTFAFITTIDEGDRWDDPKAWAKANPNLGVSVKLDDLKRQAIKAKNSPTAQRAFKRLRLNVRTSSVARAINMDVWRQNGHGHFDPDSLRGRRCYGALDLSSKIDITAWVKLFPPTPDDPLWRVVSKFWTPADSIEERQDRDKVQYQLWVKNGWIEPTAGNVVDYAEIREAVLDDQRNYEIRNIAYDPWNATQLALELQDKGLEMFEFIQGIRSYTAPTKELVNWLLEKKLDHGDNPVLTWMAGNLMVQSDKNENQMPTKKHSTGRIDGITSLIMAIGRATSEDVGMPYGDRDMAFI